jgi:hypothetical protein
MLQRSHFTYRVIELFKLWYKDSALIPELKEKLSDEVIQEWFVSEVKSVIKELQKEERGE